MKTITLIPAYNEEATIAKVILGCEDYSEEIVVCDDGSQDATAKIAEGLGVTLIQNQRNLGKGMALRRLFEKAIEMEADIVVTIDGDGQHDPDDIPRLIEALKDSDMVIGGREGIPTVRAAGNYLLKGFEKFDTQSGFRAYRAGALKDLIPSEERMSVDSEIFQKAKGLGMRIREVPVKADYGVQNPSKTNLFIHFSDAFSNGLRMTIMAHPLTFLATPGILLLGIAIWFGIQGAQYLFTQGLGSVILAILGFFFISTSFLIWTMTNLLKRAAK